MKKLFLLLFMATLLVACNDYNTPNIIGEADNSEYYVRYTITSSFYAFGSIYYADVNGTETDRLGNYSQTSLKWVVTIGPVKKGFRAYVEYKSGRADEVKLEVSKNGSPFALKASGDKSAYYTIDY